MTQKEVIFLEQNIINFERVKLGFITNLSPELLDQYAAIYRSNIDPNYVVTPWCSSCVMAMMERLIRIYEAYKLEQSQTKLQTEVIKETAKRTRKK